MWTYEGKMWRKVKTSYNTWNWRAFVVEHTRKMREKKCEKKMWEKKCEKKEKCERKKCEKIARDLWWGMGWNCPVLGIEMWGFLGGGKRCCCGWVCKLVQCWLEKWAQKYACVLSVKNVNCKKLFHVFRECVEINWLLSSFVREKGSVFWFSVVCGGFLVQIAVLCRLFFARDVKFQKSILWCGYLQKA